jgi:hypothetical protein
MKLLKWFFKKQDSADTPPKPEEYVLFSSQGEEVLQNYRLAKISMILALPVFAVLGAINFAYALVLAAAVGIIGFFILCRKFSSKGASSLLLCSLSGVAVGRLLLVPFIKSVLAIREVHFGN